MNRFGYVLGLGADADGSSLVTCVDSSLVNVHQTVVFFLCGFTCVHTNERGLAIIAMVVGMSPSYFAYA